jgi:long-chain acyl-CoA synthetase
MSTEKVWLQNYPIGVPHDLESKNLFSIVDLLEASCQQFAQRPALQSYGKLLNYQEFHEKSVQFAGFLQFLGVQKGDRVAIMMPNLLQYPIALSGILLCGAVVVNINPMYTSRELELQLKDSGAKAIIILENFAHVLAEVIDQSPIEHVVVTSIGALLGLKGTLIDWIVKYVKKMVPPWRLSHFTTFSAALHIGKTMGFSKPVISPQDIAFIQYTGGTTGVSKGAVLEHRHIIANILQIESWLALALQKKPIEQLRFICALPLYHIFALTACGLFSIRSGGLNVLITNPRDIPAFIKTLTQLKVFHIFPAVNTLFNALMQHPHFSKIDFSHLLVSIGGGMSVQKSVAQEWQLLTGSPIIEGYGLSETSPVACCNLATLDVFSGHVGLPLPSTEVSIRNDQNKDVGLDHIGEICIKGPQVMAGYWQREEDTRLAMTPDGFFKTGDLGIMDQSGFVKIIDRKKDMILVSGFNVYPNEIEEVISQMPQVLECAAIGIPSSDSGEAVKVFIVKKDLALTEKEVKDFCATMLTNYKRPKHIVFVGTLPKSNVGKILRKNLRETQ